LARGSGIERDALDILIERPERIAGFDLALAAGLRAAIGSGRPAFVEVAGRDSIAAALAAARSGAYDVLIPTIVYTGTEYGDWDVVLDSARSLVSRLSGITSLKVIEEPVLLGSPLWWHAAAGRFAGELTRKYGFSATCIACHMYLHAARVPFARELGVSSLVAGERLLHDGRVKLSQLKPALDAYSAVLRGQGSALDLPLEDISDGSLVEELAGPWPESTRQISCVLESNYRDPQGGVSYDEELLQGYLREFLVPFTERVLEGLSEGSGPLDYVGIAARTLDERSEG